MVIHLAASAHDVAQSIVSQAIAGASQDIILLKDMHTAAVDGGIADEEGTDITFTFLPGSEFETTLSVLRSGRRFVPTVFASDIFRAIDPHSAEGYFTITRPVMVFGHVISLDKLAICDLDERLRDRLL